jgi:hypothetical protein
MSGYIVRFAMAVTYEAILTQSTLDTQQLVLEGVG